MLMNHVAGDEQWTQEGIYVTFNPDLSNPNQWTTPVKLLDVPAWYPEVLGYGAEDTDTVVGAEARLFVMGHSEWDLTFEPGAASVTGAFRPEISAPRQRLRHPR
jgi:hypothetical protein